MPKVEQVLFVKKGDKIGEQLVTNDHGYVKDDCGDMCEQFIYVIPEHIWNTFMSAHKDSNEHNFIQTIDELCKQIQLFPYKDLEQLKYEGDELENLGARSVSIQSAITALEFQNYNEHHEKYIFLKDNGPYGNLGYPLLKVYYKGREIFVNYPQIVAITYTMLKILLPGEPKKRFKIATQTLLLALQTQKCSAGKMVVCIEYFLRALSVTDDPVLESIVRFIVEKENKSKYLPISSSQAQEMFDFLTNISFLFLGTIPAPTDDVVNNYNDNPLAFTLFSRQDHYDSLVINHNHLTQRRNELNLKIETIKQDALNLGGIDAVIEAIETEFFRELLVEHDETIPKLFNYPNGAVKRIRSGSGYDPSPDLRSSKIFLQICWALLEESINAGKQVNSKIEEILITTEEDRHFGHMPDPVMRSAREELQNFRVWLDPNDSKGVYQGLHNTEMELLIKWGAVVKRDPVVSENFAAYSASKLLDLFYDIQSEFKDLLEMLINYNQEYFFYLKQNIKNDLTIGKFFEITTSDRVQTNFATKKHIKKLFVQITTEVIPRLHALLLATSKSSFTDGDISVFDLFLPLSNLFVYDLYCMVTEKTPTQHVNLTVMQSGSLDISLAIEFNKNIEQKLLANERLSEQQYQFFLYRANLAMLFGDHYWALDFFSKAKYFALELRDKTDQTYNFFAKESRHFVNNAEQHTYYTRQMYVAQNKQKFFTRQIAYFEHQIIYLQQQCRYEHDYHFYQIYLREQQLHAMQPIYYIAPAPVVPVNAFPLTFTAEQRYNPNFNRDIPRAVKKYRPPI